MVLTPVSDDTMSSANDSMAAAHGALPPKIGPFRILSLLGEGGMGRVYLAQQEEPQREVALKVIASASASSEFHKRFQREIELLAALEHPGIARMYQAGMAEDVAGQVPYLAMEYVRGSDLLTHARSQNLGIREKLQLLVQVCRAVHYAHTRGAIHRDLKPGNILVNEFGQPKILDFGVAYVAGGNDLTQMTVAGEILGTVPYMPLEQLGGQSAAVDPRWDVYALGVIAYELLSGELPYPGLSKATVLTALQQVMSSAPVHLSKRLEQARGDLETIVEKAMAQEASQRYGSAAEFAADLENYLENRPILARPPTVRYVLTLFVRRHRALTAAAALVLLALVGATAVSMSFAIAANQRASEREAVNNFMEKMFTAADPDHSLGEQLTVRDVLDVARRELDTQTGLPPSAIAQLQRTLGNTYVSLGLAAQGLELLERARAITLNETDAGSSEVLRLAVEIAHAQTEAGLEKEALATLQPLLDGLPQASGERQKLFLRARVQWSELQINQGFFVEAEKQLREVKPTMDRVLGEDDDVTLEAAYNLAEVMQQQARYDEAIAAARDVVERLSRRLGPDHPRVQLAWDVIALCYRDQAKYAEADQISRDIIAVRERVFGAEHPQTQIARANWAAVLAQTARAAEGAPLARQAHDTILRVLGADAGITRNVASLRAYVVSETGAWEEAAQIYRGLIAQAESNPNGVTINDLPDYNNLGNALKNTGRLDQALPVYEKLLRLAEPLVGREHLHYGLFELNYGNALLRLGRHAQARPVLEHSHAVLLRTLGAEHPRVGRVRDDLLAVYGKLGLQDEARKLAVPAAKVES